MHRPPHFGFTLWELLLALALSITVLLLAGMALSLQVRVSQNGRDEVAQARLANAVLLKMAADLRRTVTRPPKAESPSSSSGGGASGQGSAGSGSGSSGSGSSGSGSSGSGSSGSGSSGSGSSGSGSTAGSTSTGGATSLSGTGSSSSSEEAPNVGAEFPPGVVGDVSVVQVDMSRLPHAPGMESSPVAVGGDVQTIVWYVRPGNRVEIDAPLQELVGAGGLVREVRGRATYLLEQQQGPSAVTANTVPLAPEVVGLELQYFDGTAWESSWDSAELGKLPMAVRISIAVARPATANTSRAAVGSSLEDVDWFSLVVRIPAAEAGADSGGSGTGSSSSDQSGSNTVGGSSGTTSGAASGGGGGSGATGGGR